MQGNPINCKYDNSLDLPSNNQSLNQSKDRINSRAFNGTVHSTQMSQFNRHRVTPLPNSRSERGRPRDIAKYYSAPNSKFTGRISDQHSLSRHQRVFFKQCSIARLTAGDGLECLMYMIGTQYLAGTFYLNEIDGHVRTLEEAFEK